MSADAPGPLHGLTVIEIGSIVFAPRATQHLGDMGADVIKIEPPEGDRARGLGPQRSDGMGAMFMNINRNKRSVVLDLRDEGARGTLRRLARGADVVVSSIRTSSARRLALSYEALAEHNPGLVFCHAKGFADDGAYAGKAAYDDIIQALSGLTSLQEVVGGAPRFVPTILCDKVASINAAYAIALALFHRERTGEGQHIDLPMFELMTHFNTAEHLWGYVFDPPRGEMGYQPIRYAHRRPFATSDGFVVVLPYSDQNWREFLTLGGREELLEDPRYATFAGRQQHLELVFGTLAEIVSERPTAEWLELLDGGDVPYARVNGLEDLASDPHLQSVGFWETHEHPSEGPLRVPRYPMTLSRSPASTRRLAPRLGEHTDEVLAELAATKEATR